MAADAYAELLGRMRDRSLIGSCLTLLGWDEDTMMPPAGVAHRSRQVALLSGLEHAWLVEPRVGELLAEIEHSPPASGSIEEANVREIARAHRRRVRLERELVERIAEATTFAQHAWSEARSRADFSIALPWLEKVVALKRAEAAQLDPVREPYEVLLEEYEPSARATELEALFLALEAALRPLVDRAAARAAVPAILPGCFEIDRQRALVEALLGSLGFDPLRGRIDTAEHPFTAHVGAGDCRIAVRYQRDALGEALFAALHELGHALYDHGLAPEHHGTPVGEATSLAVHESQARLFENLVGRSRGSWAHALPLARRHLGPGLEGLSVEDVHRAVNHVAPSAVRVRADALTYDLHILIRFELERSLIDGSLRVVDLPAAWTAAYQRRLGVTPRDDAEGCLQDGHWAAGMFGYFPTYTLGNVMAAQLYRAAERALGDLDAAFARGDFAGLLAWLGEHVHRHGMRWSAPELIARATGEQLGPNAMIALIEERTRPG
jgi:carboxypeptidase Taq